MSLFWSHAAGPSLYDYLNFTDHGGHFMRLTRAPKPEVWTDGTVVIREPFVLTKANAAEIADFWNHNYTDSDWRMDASKEWIESLFDHMHLALGVITTSGRLIGTIFSRKIGGNLVGKSLGTTLTNDRIFMIEGLCINQQYRNKHLAGWLISWMDYITSEHGPVAHLYSRELDSYPYLSSAIDVETYGYVETSKIKTIQTIPISLVEKEIFKTKWLEFLNPVRVSLQNNISIDTGMIDSNDMMCFASWGREDGLVLITNTHRKTTKNQTIYEVVFCTGKQTELLLNSVCYELEKIGKGGVLFGTNGAYHGALHSGFSEPWRVGTSGYHATYFYNYLPNTRKMEFILTRNSV